MSLANIYKPVQSELNLLNPVIRGVMTDSNNSAVVEMGDFLLESPGKRLRPAMLFLVAHALKKDTLNEELLLKSAASLELVHMASLVHDDVMDRAILRHNEIPLYLKWGEDAAIAFGDFLYSASLSLITSCQNQHLSDSFSQATRNMCEGELLQVCEKENLELSLENYLTIIEKKTAWLFISAVWSAAIIAGCNEETQKTLREFGLKLGTAFQMIDDYLDITAERTKLGKNPGEDISIGKLTLPILYLLEDANEDEKESILKLLSLKDDINAFQEIRNRVLSTNAAGRTFETITQHLNDAKEIISFLDESEYKKSLYDLVDFTFDRIAQYAVSA